MPTLGRARTRSVSGRVIAITGGARGIGLATAQLLSRLGADVAIGDLDGDLAEREAEAFGGLGVAVDVTDHVAFTEFIDEVERRLGPLDVLINNAGIMSAAAIEDEDEAMTARSLAINLEAMIHGTREATRRMKPRGRGHIVNVSSAASKVAGSHCSTYVATKYGIAGFTEAAAIELNGTGVEVSVVRPALCRTDLTSGFVGMKGMPFIEPEDVAVRIVEALQRPRFDVPVPRQISAVLWLNQSLPFRARLALAHLTEADKFLDHVDGAQRAAYVERVEAKV